MPAEQRTASFPTAVISRSRENRTGQEDAGRNSHQRSRKLTKTTEEGQHKHAMKVGKSYYDEIAMGLCMDPTIPNSRFKLV